MTDVPPYRSRLATPPAERDPQQVVDRYRFLGKERDRVRPEDIADFRRIQAILDNSLENRVAKLEQAMKERSDEQH